MFTPAELEAARQAAIERATELVDDTGSSPMDTRAFRQLVGNEALQYLQMLYEPLDTEFRMTFARVYREQERMLLHSRGEPTKRTLYGELTYQQCRARLAMFLNWLRSMETVKGDIFRLANSELLDMYLDEYPGLYLPETAPGTATRAATLTDEQDESGGEQHADGSIQAGEQAVQDDGRTALHRLSKEGPGGRVGSDAQRQPDAPRLRDQASQVEVRPPQPATERRYVGYVHLGEFWGQDRRTTRTVSAKVPNGARFLDLMLTPDDGVIALAEFPRHLGYERLNFGFFIFPRDAEPEVKPDWQYIGMVTKKQHTLVVYRT